jgi:hypothetical protein
MAQHNTHPNDWKLRFIVALREHGVIKFACEAAGITRQTALTHKKNDKTFAEDWEAAIEEATDILEKIAINRAAEKSDALLMFLLRGNRKKYADRREVETKMQIDGGVRLKLLELLDADSE